MKHLRIDVWRFLIARRMSIVILVIGILSARAISQGSSEEHKQRIGFSAGMGVNYHTAQDIVNHINGSGFVSQRVSEFKSGVEFFGALSIPLSSDWLVKGEYVYLLASYAQNTVYGSADFTYIIHMPTILMEYVLIDGSTYNLGAGLGLGYHFATFTEKSPALNGDYSGSGVGSLMELEGNTALGEDLFAHLGVQMRWDFIGDLKNGAANLPSGGVAATSLHFFSVGARLGMSYYF